MSAAAYSTERGWDIPVYIWPPVLGVSVALHLSVVVFGLLEMRLPQQEPVDLTETEIIIESGGVAFEDVAMIAPPQPEIATNEALDVVAPEVAVSSAVSGEVNELPPVASDVLSAAEAPTDIVESVEVPSVAEAVPPEAVAAQVQEARPVAPEPVPLSQTEPIEAVVPSAVVDVVAVSAEPPPVTPAASPDAVEIAVVEPVTAGQGTEVQLSGDVSPGISLDAVPPPDEIVVNSVAAAEVSPTVSSVIETQTIPSVGVVPVDPAPDGAVTVTAPETVTAASSEIVPPATVEIETVSPAREEVSEVQPAETVVAAISPSEPEASAVPTVAPPSEPAENVPPVEVATIDPLARVTNYVENYDFGDCAHLSVLAAGPDSASVTAFGSGIDPFARFDKRFSADQGYEAAIELRLVTPRQCGLLNALGLSEGIEAAGLVELDGTVVRSGTAVAGVIRRDLPLERIATAEQAGLNLSGKGPPELYLIDDAGQIHDGREFLLPETSARTAGAWRFKVPVTLMASQSEETALVLAIWNRPAARQPPRFRVLPSGRIAGILAQPGVYSLSAFKVSP